MMWPLPCAPLVMPCSSWAYRRRRRGRDAKLVSKLAEAGKGQVYREGCVRGWVGGHGGPGRRILVSCIDCGSWRRQSQLAPGQNNGCASAGTWPQAGSLEEATGYSTRKRGTGQVGQEKGGTWSMHHCGVNTEKWGERCRLEASKRAGFTLPAAGCRLLLSTTTHLPPPQLLLPCLVPRAPHRRRW